MGARGPAQKSKKELQRDGSWLAKDRPDDLELTPAAPEPPASLAGEARKEWKRVVGLLWPKSVLSEGDRAALTLLCELWDEDRSLGRQLKRMTIGTMDWKRVHTARQDVRKQLKDLLKSFGLTPADRTRVKVIERPRPKTSRADKYFGQPGVIAKIG